MLTWHTPKLLDRLKWESKVKIMERQGVGHVPWLVAFREYRGVLEFWDGTRKNDKQLIHSLKSAQTKQHIG
jgi:hypothetical protein